MVIVLAWKSAGLPIPYKQLTDEITITSFLPESKAAEASGESDAGAESDAGGAEKLGALMLFGQGVATSIDALSVGFTIAEYRALEAFGSSVIIAVVTFFICMGGLLFGRKFGEKLAGRATILGGLILIGIGAEIFIRGVF